MTFRTDSRGVVLWVFFDLCRTADWERGNGKRSGGEGGDVAKELDRERPYWGLERRLVWEGSESVGASSERREEGWAYPWREWKGHGKKEGGREKEGEGGASLSPEAVWDDVCVQRNFSFLYKVKGSQEEKHIHILPL
jgi:hypothetical protein